MDPAALAPALERLRTALTAVPLTLELPGRDAADAARRELAAQVDDYLLPRLRSMEAPLLIVVGGSTGAGKSTLVNTLVGEQVSTAGVLRPTTRAPVLVCHPDEVAWFADDRVLPGLARTTGVEAGPGGLTLRPCTALGPGLALLDAPDIDSVVEANRTLARQLLAAADAWLFVTTAARYADAVPWDLLHAARERGTALSLVLDRVPPEAIEEVTGHLREMLAEQHLDAAELLVVPETELLDGRLPDHAAAQVRAWLDALAGDAAARAALVRDTLAGAVASVPDRTLAVERAATEQLGAAADLRRASESHYAEAVDEVAAAMRDGTLLRGEVLARWHEVVGTGDLMRALEGHVSRLRDRVRSLVTGRPAESQELQQAVSAGVEAVVRAAADRAAERTAASWRSHAAGRRLLESATRVDAASADLDERAREEIRAWQRAVFDLVRDQGVQRRTSARLASFGVNGLGLVVMIAVFASTGGLTGTEIAVAGGTSALSQKLLEAIFGDEAVRRLAARAREDLLTRVQRLMDDEAARYAGLLDPVAPAPEGLDELRHAREVVEAAA